MTRLYLSPPHLSGNEIEMLRDAVASGWIAPVGPHVDGFERELAERVGVPHAVVLSSGTAALHLLMRILGVEPGDEVIVSTLTFAASANAIVYERGVPVFIDSDAGTWNMDPNLLAEELEACARRGKLPRAVVVVDLYGQCADYDPIREACKSYEVPLIQDAAEALGATYRGRPAGAQGKASVLSFNGNKIITTSGGGALLSDDLHIIEQARHLSTQARDPAPHYQHSKLGFNYRLSNLLASVGRAQLGVLDSRVERRRRINALYREQLADIAGIEFMPEADYGSCTFWLTCITVDESRSGVSPEQIRLHLEGLDIESRPVWKPMHMQPIFSDSRVRGGGVSEDLFRRGLCLPSGSEMSDEDVGRVAEGVRVAVG